MSETKKIVVSGEDVKRIIVNGKDGQREYGIEDGVARQDVQEIVAGAPEELDSFREAFEAFKEGDEALAEVNTVIQENAAAIADETNRATAAEEKLAEDVNAAMVAVEGEKERAQGAEAAIHDKVAATAVAQAEALTQAVNELNKKIDTKEENGKVALATEIVKLKNGDTIVGQAMEIHSRNGKTVTDSFLVRTTAGSGTIGDGVASLKSVGGNIVKNLVDINKLNAYYNTVEKFGDIIIAYNSKNANYGFVANEINIVTNHKYYVSSYIFSDSEINLRIFVRNNGKNVIIPKKMWCIASAIVNAPDVTVNLQQIAYINYTTETKSFVGTKPLLIDLTEMFGAGNEPDKDTCDRLFGTMDALPQGLNIAKPTEFKSTGFNQFNPDNVLEGKAIVDNAIVNGDKKIAVIPCLPCKVGVGENNGYCIHGDFGDDINVYLAPLNPMEVDGELYMHKLTKDATTDTYVPQIKGYMLVEVPTTANLCAHFLWSEDKCERDTYEPYFESKIELPTIPQMSEWGLAGIQSSGTLVCDEIDFERGVYVKRISSVDIGSLNLIYNGDAADGSTYIDKNFFIKPSSSYILSDYNNITRISARNDGRIVFISPISNNQVAFKDAMQGVMLYYELAEPEEYPLPKVDNNYISSDYGIEQFDSVVPCNANNLYYMRSLAGETRNFLDRMYANTGKEESPIAVADYITKGIEGNKELATNAPNLALRALFVAAGAEYNDTDQIIQKTAPWETEEKWRLEDDGTYTYWDEPAIVEHLPKHYYLNGLGDITEEQMQDIYNAGRLGFYGRAYYANNKKIRTVLPSYISGQEGFGSTEVAYLFFGATIIEVAALTTNFRISELYGFSSNADKKGMFNNCTQLKFVQTLSLGGGNTSVNNTFSKCYALELVKLKKIAVSISFGDSPMIWKRSILYTIQNAAPTSEITITLHADAYARLANDADIVAALAAQPLVTLVSA